MGCFHALSCARDSQILPNVQSKQYWQRANERATGIEPAWPAWKAGTLPLSYARVGVSCRVMAALPTHFSNAVATRVALWPPKPNELFKATRTFFSRATFGV